MDLYAGGSRLLRKQGAMGEAIADVRELLDGRPAALRPARRANARWAECWRIGILAVSALASDCALMPQLHEHVPAGLADGAETLGPILDCCIGHPSVGLFLGRRSMIDRAGFRYDDRCPPKNTALVIVDQLWDRFSVDTPLPLHARHNEPVGQCEALQGERGEKRRRVYGTHRNFFPPSLG